MEDARALVRLVVGNGVVIELGTLQEDTASTAGALDGAVVCHDEIVACTLNHVGTAAVAFFAGV